MLVSNDFSNSGMKWIQAEESFIFKQKRAILIYVLTTALNKLI